MNKNTFYYIIALAIFLTGCLADSNTMKDQFYLYKILSTKDWTESKNLNYLKLPPQDDRFIHLATKEQINSIIAKYWPNHNEILIAKLDPSKLIGKLTQETNPGGKNKYYHLYNGKIPLSAVVEILSYKNQ